MFKFKLNGVYAINKFGRVSKTDSKTVVKVTPKYVTFVTTGTSFPEPERVKIRRDGENEYAIVFGGIISDTVYASDLISTQPNIKETKPS